MAVILDLDESALLFKILDDSLSRLVSVHAGILRIVIDYLCVIGQDVYNGQVMAQTDLEVVRIMRGSYLNDTGTEVYLDIIIGDNGYLAVDYGQDERLADDILISLIIGVDGNSGIAEQGLGSGRCKLKIAASVLERIAKMPEVTRLILIFDLGVRDRGQAMGAPVDYSLTPVNESLFIEVAKTSLTASLQPSSRVKRSRSQSQDEPIFLSCSIILPPNFSFHAHARSRKPSRRHRPL